MVTVQVEVDEVSVSLPWGEKLALGDECQVTLKRGEVYIVTDMISGENTYILMRRSRELPAEEV